MQIRWRSPILRTLCSETSRAISEAEYDLSIYDRHALSSECQQSQFFSSGQSGKGSRGVKSKSLITRASIFSGYLLAKGTATREPIEWPSSTNFSVNPRSVTKECKSTTCCKNKDQMNEKKKAATCSVVKLLFPQSLSPCPRRSTAMQRSLGSRSHSSLMVSFQTLLEEPTPCKSTTTI